MKHWHLGLKWLILSVILLLLSLGGALLNLTNLLGL